MPASQAHQQSARQGFVISQRSWGREVNAVGVPLGLPEQQLVVAFHCAGAASQVPLARMRREIGPRLVETVQAIAQALRQQRASARR